MRKVMYLLSRHKDRIIICNFIILFIIIIGLSVKIKELHSDLEMEISKPPTYIHDLKIQTIEKEIIVEKEVYKDTPDIYFFKNVELNVTPIMQLPELPTGCEVTSLAIILQYYGYNIDKLTLSDKFLPKGEIGQTLPWEGFIGNPRDSHSYGAYSKVLVTTANSYLETQETSILAKDISGLTMEDICGYVKDGFPVMVWVTIDMEEPYESTTWTINKKDFTWLANEHCVVITGFMENTYIVADPLKGIVEYNKGIFESRFDGMGRQAIVLQ